jgi:HD-GYP domain-containing protein (c-di-GMP phosphodiesterase class II)
VSGVENNEPPVPSLLTLCNAIEARDPYTRGHSARVTAVALVVAERLASPPWEVEAIRIGGPVHDVGKVGIPDGVLLKAGPLDEEESAIVRRHPEVGADLVRGVPGLEAALTCVLYHHERWDGRGYPARLAGDQIPREARILAVADAFDAMTSTRPYRRALPGPIAVAEIQRCAARQFDPRISSALARAWCAGDLDADRPSGDLRVAS